MLVCNELAPVKNGEACAIAMSGAQIARISNRGANAMRRWCMAEFLFRFKAKT
jgi:hypothetical protein